MNAHDLLLSLNILSVVLIVSAIWVLIFTTPVENRFWRNVLIALMFTGLMTRLFAIYTVLFTIRGVDL